MTFRAAFAAMFFAVLGVRATSAHHSYGSYLQDQQISVEGTLSGIMYANPHVILTIRTKDSNIYRAELQSPNILRSTGLDRATLHYGDTVIVRGSPKRDPA